MFYSPLYHSMWSDEALDGAPFEEKGFFAFLWSHERIRPSGIYRVTDAQLAADTGLHIKRVGEYLRDLAERRRIIRDGAWLFVRGFFARQPKQKFLLRGVERDLAECSSIPVLEAFLAKYPLQQSLVIEHLTIRRGNPCPTHGPCSFESGSTEQMQIQSRADAEQITHQVEDALYVPSDFEAFWQAYPKHENRKKTEEVWNRLKPDARLQDRLLAAIAEQRNGSSWANGYIPAPFRWLQDRRWEDEVRRERAPLMNPSNQAVLEQFLDRRKEEP